MKHATFLLVLGLPLWGAAGNPALVQNQTVYLLPMSNGFDQYLATELLRSNTLSVTTDPKQATVILTDRLGEPLEIKMKEYYDPPPVEVKEKDKDKDSRGGAVKTNAIPPRVSSFGRGRGTIYLVDRQSRRVLWSTYARPKDGSSGELNHTAEKVAKRLKQDATLGERH